MYVIQKCTAIYSEFIFHRAKWSRVQMDEDFLKLSRMFNAINSVVRVPDLDTRHKIAILASKQVIFLFPLIIVVSKFNIQTYVVAGLSFCLLSLVTLLSCFYRTIVLLTCCMAGKMEGFQFK